jgi:transcriptional regulator with XRE-family HTH domain
MQEAHGITHGSAARTAARMSMAEVAEQAGLTKGFVSKLERDLANVSVASLIRLCDALGVSVGSLFQAPTGEVIRHGAYPPIAAKVRDCATAQGSKGRTAPDAD